MIMGTTESIPENKTKPEDNTKANTDLKVDTKIEQKIDSKSESKFDPKQDDVNQDESYFIDGIKCGAEKYVISQDGELIGITNTREEAVEILMEKIDESYLAENDDYYLLRNRMLYNVYRRGGMSFLIGYDSLETSFKIQNCPELVKIIETKPILKETKEIKIESKVEVKSETKSEVKSEVKL